MVKLSKKHIAKIVAKLKLAEREDLIEKLLNTILAKDSLMSLSEASFKTYISVESKTLRENTGYLYLLENCENILEVIPELELFFGTKTVTSKVIDADKTCETASKIMAKPKNPYYCPPVAPQDVIPVAADSAETCQDCGAELESCLCDFEDDEDWYFEDDEEEEITYESPFIFQDDVTTSEIDSAYNYKTIMGLLSHPFTEEDFKKELFVPVDTFGFPTSVSSEALTALLETFAHFTTQFPSVRFSNRQEFLEQAYIKQFLDKDYVWK